MMKSFQLSYFQLLCLLIAALLGCKAQTERPCKQVHQLNINYFQGDNMSISCLTTTHPLEPLTVKLHKSNQDKDILIFPDISPASEHQRWSVRKDDGNVTLDLKDIRLSDSGHYDCQIYKDQDCLHATRINLKVRECKWLNPVHPTPGSSVLLPCSEHPLQNRTDKVIWKVIIGHQSTNITQYQPPNKPSSSTEKVPRPLYERARQLENGSLHIRDIVHTDALWYQCKVNEETCYEVKLQLKVVFLETSSTLAATVITNVSRDTSAAVTTNSTVVVMTTVVSLCVLISLTVCAILYFKKRRHKNNSQTQLNGRFSVYYSHVADAFDVPLYSLIAKNTATMTTFGAEQSEAPAFKPDDTYEKYTL